MNARACLSDDCEQNHCPKCGGHTLGWLDTFQKCQSCELEEEYNQRHVVCIIREGGLDIQRYNETIGTVEERGGEPTITLMAKHGMPWAQLSFTDLAIVQDNWNMYQELTEGKVS